LRRPSSEAWRLEQYCKPAIASITLPLVSPETVSELFETRDTVAVETPANLATSLSVQDRTFNSTDLFGVACSSLRETERHPPISCLPIDHDLQVFAVFNGRT
jgi:hypothetical protein